MQLEFERNYRRIVGVAGDGAFYWGAVLDLLICIIDAFKLALCHRSGHTSQAGIAQQTLLGLDYLTSAFQHISFRACNTVAHCTLFVKINSAICLEYGCSRTGKGWTGRLCGCIGSVSWHQLLASIFCRTRRDGQEPSCSTCKMPSSMVKLSMPFEPRSATLTLSIVSPYLFCAFCIRAPHDIVCLHAACSWKI